MNETNYNKTVTKINFKKILILKYMCFFVNTWNNEMQQELCGHWRCELAMSMNDMSKYGQPP